MLDMALPLMHFLLSLLLLPHGYNCFLLLFGALRYRVGGGRPIINHPMVTVQLPIYNERYVVSRLLRSVAELHWPRDKLEILVLDDSNDETSFIIDSEVARLRSEGLNIHVLRRRDRKGFKAGALQNALKHTHGKYIAIFDADFTPPPDFLERVVTHLEEDPRLGFVQARLGHLNRGYNGVTEMISLAIDGHFMVEQAGREAMSMVINFNGSGGVLRTEAVLDVGGWRPEMLTEDLDMSYRMRIRGWGSRYLRDVVVPGEVPINIVDFKNQQSRWAVGSLQCARRLLGDVWRSSHLTLGQKLESTLHLTNYLIFPLMMITIILLVLLLILNRAPSPLFQTPFSILFSIGALGASTLYSSTIILQDMSLKEKLPYLGLLAAVGVGLSAHLTISMMKGLLSKRLEFKTTPKYNIDEGGKRISKISKPIGRLPLPETVMTLLTIIGMILAVKNQILPVLSTLFIYLIGYSTVIYYSTSRQKIS